MQLDRALQFAAQRINVFAAGLVIQTFDTLAGQLASIGRQRFPIALLFDEFNHAVAGSLTEHHQVKQGVGTQTICTVHRSTSALARCVQTFHRHFVFAALRHNDFAVIVGRDTAHHVVGSRHNGNRVFNRVDTGKLNGNLADTWQFFHNFFCADMVDFQQNVVFVFTAATTLINFHRHRTGNYVARGQVFYGWRIAFHKAFAVSIQQNTALTAYAFGNQHACTCHAGRVELPEFHIFQRNACTGANTQTVAGIHIGIGRRSINTTAAAGSKHHGFSVENINFAGFHFHGGYTDDVAVFITNQILRRPFHKELRIGTDVLLIQGMQHRMAGTVGNCAGTFYRAFTVFGGVTAERTLINFAAFDAVKRHTHVFQFNHCFRRGATHKLNRILVAQPVGTFHGIVHVPVPTVLLHITQRGRNTTLRRYGMRTGREHFRQNGTIQTGFG